MNSRFNVMAWTMGAETGLEPATASVWGWYATFAILRVAGRTGFEPATLGLTVRCSTD